MTQEPKLYDYYFVGYEADDVLGSFVCRFKSSVDPVNCFADACDIIKKDHKGDIRITDFYIIKTAP